MTRFALILLAIVATATVVGAVGLAFSVAKVLFVGCAVLFLASIALSLIREHRASVSRQSDHGT